MQTTFRYFDIMERYARGPITAQEKADFEQQLLANRELAIEWADYLLIARSIRTSLLSKASAKPNITQLVKDARDLAKSEGLLFTDEDIWTYLRGKSPLPQSVLIERRRATDPGFDTQFKQEEAVVQGIQAYFNRQRSIGKVRDTLRNEGFTEQLHRQIEQDIAKEKRQSLGAVTPSGNTPANKARWVAVGALLLALFGAGLWLALQKNTTLDAYIEAEMTNDQKTISISPLFSHIQEPNSLKAIKFLEQSLPDAALSHLRKVPLSERTPETIFLEGYALIEKKDYRNALEKLSQLPDINAELNRKAQWYRALCQIELKNYPAAHSELSSLSQVAEQQQLVHWEKAAQLLDKLPK